LLQIDNISLYYLIICRATPLYQQWFFVLAHGLFFFFILSPELLFVFRPFWASDFYFACSKTNLSGTDLNSRRLARRVKAMDGFHKSKEKAPACLPIIKTIMGSLRCSDELAGV